jgi:hypothetical protein
MPPIYRENSTHQTAPDLGINQVLPLRFPFPPSLTARSISAPRVILTSTGCARLAIVNDNPLHAKAGQHRVGIELRAPFFFGDSGKCSAIQEQRNRGQLAINLVAVEKLFLAKFAKMKLRQDAL